VLVVAVSAAVAGGLLPGGSPNNTPTPSSPIAAIETPTATPTASPTASVAASPTASVAASPTASVAASPTAKATATPVPTDENGHPCVDRQGSSTIASRRGAAPALAAPDIAAGHFAAAGPLPADGGYDTATLLSTGKVLFVGAGAAELYDPATNHFTPTGPIVDERRDPLVVLLGNGKVLVAGGMSFRGCAVSNIESVELYDPTTGHFTSLGTPLPGDMYQTVTRLFDGTVLFTGGWTQDGDHPEGYRSSALYNPTTGTFTLTGGTLQPPSCAAVTLLPDQTVLFAGGWVDSGGGNWTPTDTAMLYRPDHGDFVLAAGLMTHPRSYATATRLSTGKVLIAGGDTTFDPLSGDASAEIYDTTTGQFTATGSMVVGRDKHTATLLPGDRVLFTGGVGGSNSAEVWADGASSATAGPMTQQRSQTTAIYLPNGKVLVVGYGTADLYQP
jgi:hypothetical protein